MGSRASESMVVIMSLLSIVDLGGVIPIVAAQSVPTTAAAPGPEVVGEDGTSNTAGIVGGLVGGLVGLSILLCFLYMKCVRKPKPRETKSVPTNTYITTGFLRPDDESKQKHIASQSDGAALSAPAPGSGSVDGVIPSAIPSAAAGK